MQRRVLGWIAAFALIGLLPVGAVQGGASEEEASASSPTVIFLARHAEKETGDDPQLTPHGRSRSESLARMLEHEKLDAILSTPYRRTLQTAAPVAESQGLETVVTPIEGSAAQFVKSLGERILRDHRGGKVLVVGHSNTVPETMDALGAAGVPRLNDREYGDLFLVVVPAEGNPTWLRLNVPAGD